MIEQLSLTVFVFTLLIVVAPRAESKAPAAWDDEHIQATCPLPPAFTGPLPESVRRPRTALASHPRSGSTWLRFLVEHATGKPCGFEKADWANVLSHHGEDSNNPSKVNSNGILIKTHSHCHGCWPESTGSPPPMPERFTIKKNSTFTSKEISQIMGKDWAKRFKSHGICLNTNKKVDNLLTIVKQGKGGSNGRSLPFRQLEDLVCDDPYDRALLLFRYPLDAVRSNYHYRTRVLHMRGGSSWSEDDYDFPRERAQAWTNFYKTWARFAELRPVMWLFYEDMKANTTRELRRVVDFLGYGDVSDKQLECAVAASTMQRLQKSDRINKGGWKNEDHDNFFGSRSKTEALEELVYPDHVLRDFDAFGLFDVAHDKLGYSPRPETSDIIISARATSTEL